MGSFADALDADGDAVRLIDVGSLAIDGDGSTLYAVSTLGLTTFQRNSETGRLTGGESIDDDLSGSLLVHDAERDRLIADRCGTWRVYTGLDGTADAIEGSDLTVEGDPANCGRRLFADPNGEFLYRVAPELGIDIFAIEDGAVRHEESTQLAGIKDAVIARNGGYVYAAQLDSTSRVRTFRRDQESGLLTLQPRYRYFRSIDDMDTLAIADDERLFVTRKSTGDTYMYVLAEGVLTYAGAVSLLPEADLSVQLARPFEFASARSGTTAVDVFGASVAVGLEIQQSQVDLLANGQADRFGNRVPLFGAPNGLASSPDGRHVYLASYQHGIVAFERVGAGVEPEDPYVRLDILEVSSGMVSFAAEMDSDGCIAVADLEHDGVAYTVQSSRWQWRPNADWAWSDVAGTSATNELCPHSPSEHGHYRLVVEMEVDGETRSHTSNILVQDDHGDSIDDATTVGVPSTTVGWLDPDDEDYFRIDLTESGELTVHSKGWINAEGRLLDEDGDFIASDSDSGADFNFRIVRDVAAGTYFVRIHERFSRPGAYTVHADFEAHVADLVMDSISVTDSSPDAGAAFTLNATVRNIGEADSTPATLRFYRSTDESITTDDDEVGTADVGAVAGGGTSQQSVELTAPTEPGAYHYGACVDTFDDESDTTNNCSVAVAVSVAIELDPANGNPAGIVYVNGVLYVLDDADDKLYAYSTSGTRDPDSDFDMDSANSSPSGVVFANDRFQVVDSRDRKVYAYRLSGERDAASDFDLAAVNGSARGIAATDDGLRVVDWSDEKVYAYRLSGERNSDADFDLAAPNRYPEGITHASGLLFVVDSLRDRAYAYGTSGERAADSEFDLNPSNRFPKGMTYGSGTFFVVDSAADQIFAHADERVASGSEPVVEGDPVSR